MLLSKFPRRRYTQRPTPIEFMPRLSNHLGGKVEIWIKRDDLTGLAMGGNKTRKLEFLLADALASNADTIITIGAVQSNHCRLTLSAAIKEGLDCQLLIEERIPGSFDRRASGNNLLFHILGAERIELLEPNLSPEAGLERMAQKLRSEGRNPYIIPGGGSNPLGALGYVACVEELVAQAFEASLEFDFIVCASGSAGTHAGILAGIHSTNSDVPVIGISVRRPVDEQASLVLNLAQKTCRLIGIPEIQRETVTIFDDWVGPGYSLPTSSMIEAVDLTAKHESILLDPVYTGKAMAGLIGLIQGGYIPSNSRVLFVHTGGAPALFQYGDHFLDNCKGPIH